MASLNVSLPESMRDWIEAQVQQHGYGTASELVRDLIRSEQRRQAQQELEAKLLEGLGSGSTTELTDADWSALRKKARRRAAGRPRS